MDQSGFEFDVTTEEKRRKASQLFLEYGLFFPPLLLAKALWDGVSSFVTDSNKRELEAQKKAAIDIIRAGKENGVDELEITMSEKADIGLGSSIDGTPIEFIFGASGSMKLKVKYKN
jgi:hypothetical protein